MALSLTFKKKTAKYVKFTLTDADTSDLLILTSGTFIFAAKQKIGDVNFQFNKVNSDFTHVSQGIVKVLITIDDIDTAGKFVGELKTVLDATANVDKQSIEIIVEDTVID